MTDRPARIVTLGALDVIGGAGVEPRDLTRRRKPLALLVYLLHGKGAAAFHERDMLVATVWPESAHQQARASLRQAIATIERHLGPIIERRGRDRIRVVPQSLSLDVADFERAVAEGRWADAVSLYAGPFLEGVHLPSSAPLQRWIDEQQVRLADAHRRAHEALDLPTEAPSATQQREEATPETEPVGLARSRWTRQRGGMMTGAAALVALAAWGLSDDRSESSERLPSVAVPPFATVTAIDSADLHAMSLAVGQRLTELDSVTVVPFHELRSALASRARSRATLDGDPSEATAKALGIDILVRGTALGGRPGDDVVIDVVDVRSGRAVGPSIVGGGDGALLSLLAERVATRVAGAVSPDPGIRGEHQLLAQPPTAAAHAEFSRALDRFAAGDIEAAEAHARRALEHDPEYAGAAIEVAVQRANQQDYGEADSIVRALRASGRELSRADRGRLVWLEAVLTGDRAARLQRVGSGIEAVRARTGGDPDYQLAWDLSNVGRLRESLAAAGPGGPDIDPPTFRWRLEWIRTVNFHRLGDHDAELAVALRYLEAFPEEEQPYRLVVRALAAAGDLAAVERRVVQARRSPLPFLDARLAHEAAIELFAHGREGDGQRWIEHALRLYPDFVDIESQYVGDSNVRRPGHARTYAEALALAGRWGEARAAYEPLLAARPDDVGLRAPLAVIDAHSGHPERARATIEWLEEGHPGSAGGRTLWQARIAAALGDDDAVSLLLGLAVERGVERPGWIHTFPEWRWMSDSSEVDRWLEASIVG